MSMYPSACRVYEPQEFAVRCHDCDALFEVHVTTYMGTVDESEMTCPHCDSNNTDVE